MTNFTQVLQPITSSLNWPIGFNRLSAATFHLILKITCALKLMQTSVENNSYFQNSPNPDIHTIEAEWRLCQINNNITLVSAGGLSFLHSLLDLALSTSATWKKPNKAIQFNNVSKHWFNFLNNQRDPGIMLRSLTEDLVRRRSSNHSNIFK